jgi:HSP20 family protein
MPNVISWKKSEIASLRGHMEDFFDHFFHRLSCSCLESGLMDATDWQIEEDDNRLLVTLQAPDLTSEDIDVTLTEDTITIRIQRQQSATRDEGERAHREQLYQSSSRSVLLPANANRDEISARYVEGVLTVEVPKTEKKTHKIAIKT